MIFLPSLQFIDFLPEAPPDPCVGEGPFVGSGVEVEVGDGDGPVVGEGVGDVDGIGVGVGLGVGDEDGWGVGDVLELVTILIE